MSGEDCNTTNLLSWNVAGWKTAHEHIKRLGGLQQFLDKHQASIFCFQETKLTLKVVADEFASLGADEVGYDSFWSCNEGKGGQRQGLNGVVTFARKGRVLRADSAPLGQSELDAEGRCVLTDHGLFVVFNVYVPNSQGGLRLPFKIRWLRALRAAMQRERAKGKHVILAGDLNMKHRPRDVHWTSRLISLKSLKDYLQSESNNAEARDLASTIVKHWHEMATALESKEIRVVENKGKSELWGAFVPAADGSPSRLGQRFDSEAQARAKFTLQGVGCERDGSVVVGPFIDEPAFMMKSGGDIFIQELMESIKKTAGLEVPRNIMKVIADGVGKNPSEPLVQEWLHNLITEDGMVDSFAEFHHDADERYTCWDQSKCLRHDNIGSRIDYIFVDRELFAQHAQRGLELYSGAATGTKSPSSAEAAKSAALLGGLMAPVGLDDKIGMAELHEEEYRAQFRESQSSGIVYTAQQLSDHVAISLALNLPARSVGLQLGTDAATRLCQPHRTVKRISDFFSKRPIHGNDAAPTTKRHKVAGA